MCPKLPPTAKELDVKQVYYDIIEKCPPILEYLPEPHGKNDTLPENGFFWTILFSLAYEAANTYIQEVMNTIR